MLKEHFYMVPSVMFGGMYFNVDYINKILLTNAIVSKNSNGIDTMALLGFEAGYCGSEYFFMGIFGGFGTIFEKDSLLYFVTSGLVLGLRF
ncbi:MAG: hypothetical protein N2316_04395 [Spirochaetes bacterium]|nr:hypothetical protein [Spirochaetota bacterium]